MIIPSATLTPENGRRIGFLAQNLNIVSKSEASPPHAVEDLLIFNYRYPKQQRLLSLKKASISQNALPPLYLPYADLNTLQPGKFDVILLDPPFSSSFTWDHLQELPVPSLAADPSFVFLWVGSGAGDGLERGREVLAKWGYRRCEDVVWVKTNKTSNNGPGVRRIIGTTFGTAELFFSSRQTHPRRHYSLGQNSIV